MFDILFMRQKQNETVRLIWIVPHGPFIKVQTAVRRELTRADVFAWSREH